MTSRSRIQSRMIAKRVTRKQAAASLAAFAPLEWQPPVADKKRRAKIVQEPLPDMARDDDAAD